MVGRRFSRNVGGSRGAAPEKNKKRGSSSTLRDGGFFARLVVSQVFSGRFRGTLRSCFREAGRKKKKKSLRCTVALGGLSGRTVGGNSEFFFFVLPSGCE
ncbi:uncharacterized protein TM35_000491100 [Trypanosoma theileri]|uniref:Uncharacterized protein n=1 Tax=Trypanosoma theileri TaxID=67003 RepID=A0A1X0NH41_9TRYP|nr:uncharacterized protein TM35_000491100 [Trypanosoma theileri]ORC84104.1 hypothetical protein TM35_000491100 [Trypanosoma theileri]